MKQTIFFILICIIVSTSCNTDTIKKTGISNLPYMIEIEKNLNDKKSVPLSTIGEKLEYISLETTPESLIETIRRIVINDSSIFINDYTKLLQFDRNGKFIRQIGSIGRGPEEYLEVVDFYVENESIFILCTPKVLEFDLHGHFINSFNTYFTSARFMAFDTNKLMFYSINQPGMTNDTIYSWYITDNKGQLKTKFLNFHKRMNSQLNIAEMPLYTFNGIPHFIEFGSDTLFYLNNEHPVPYALFNLGNKKMETDPIISGSNIMEDINRLAKKLWIYSLDENKEHLFLMLQYGFSDSSRYGIFNKNTFQTTILENKGFTNDMDGGIPFWPKYVYNDSVLVDYIDAFKLLSIINENDEETLRKKGYSQSEKLKLLAKQLDENSNPILMILK